MVNHVQSTDAPGICAITAENDGYPKVSARAGLERRPAGAEDGRPLSSLVERARPHDSGSGPCMPRKLIYAPYYILFFVLPITIITVIRNWCTHQ